MSCKVIGIIGESNVGKTTTLNELFDKLKELNATVVENKQQVGNDERDFSCVFSFHEKKIAIFTMGDVVKYLKTAFKTYSPCDYLICAISNDVLNRKTMTLPDNRELFYIIRDEKDAEKSIVRKEKREDVINKVLSSITY